MSNSPIATPKQTATDRENITQQQHHQAAERIAHKETNETRLSGKITLASIGKSHKKSGAASQGSVK